MGHIMKVLGKITKLLVRGNSIFLREINMKEIFLIIILMEMENTLFKMVEYMMDNG